MAFLQRAYGYSESTASYLVGIVYDISLFALFFGWLTDRYGRRENWLLASSALLFVAFVLEASVPHFPAWLLTTIVGFGYTIFGPTFWSSIPLLVLPSYVGAALGFLKFCHYGGVAVLTAIAGAVLDSRIAKGQPPWQFLIVMLFCTTTIGLVFACLVIYLNARTGRRLSPSQQKRDQVNVLKEVTPLYTADERYSRYGSVLSHVQSPEKSSLDLTHALINKWSSTSGLLISFSSASLQSTGCGRSLSSRCSLTCVHTKIVINKFQSKSGRYVSYIRFSFKQLLFRYSQTFPKSARFFSIWAPSNKPAWKFHNIVKPICIVRRMSNKKNPLRKKECRIAWCETQRLMVRSNSICQFNDEYLDCHKQIIIKNVGWIKIRTYKEYWNTLVTVAAMARKMANVNVCHKI